MSTDLENKFSERLAALFLKRGIKQTALCEAIGESKATVSNWINLGREPKYETLIKIADFFGVSVDYLIGREINEREITIKPRRSEYELINQAAEKLGETVPEYMINTGVKMANQINTSQNLAVASALKKSAKVARAKLEQKPKAVLPNDNESGPGRRARQAKGRQQPPPDQAQDKRDAA